jgi:hypothetical protein
MRGLWLFPLRVQMGWLLLRPRTCNRSIAYWIPPLNHSFSGMPLPWRASITLAAGGVSSLLVHINNMDALEETSSSKIR